MSLALFYRLICLAKVQAEIELFLAQAVVVAQEWITPYFRSVGPGIQVLEHTFYNWDKNLHQVN